MADITKRFVHLTHNAQGQTLFNNGSSGAASYFVLTGSTAEEASFEQATLTENELFNGLTSYTVIPPTSVVFVDFPDGTTGIVTHMKFYSKLDELGGGATPANPSIRVLDGYDDFPTTSNTDLNISFGDVCAVRTIYSGSQITGFAIAVCDNAYSDDDGSGNITYVYHWQEVFRWPNSVGWENATANLGS